MFWKSGALPLSLSLVAFLAPLACRSPVPDPVREAKIFLEIATAAMEEEFVDLYRAVSERICAADQAELRQTRARFLQALPPDLSTQLKLNDADIIAGLGLPEHLSIDRGRLISSDGRVAVVAFPITSPNEETPPLLMTMVLEENKKWHTCDLLSSKRGP